MRDLNFNHFGWMFSLCKLSVALYLGLVSCSCLNCEFAIQNMHSRCCLILDLCLDGIVTAHDKQNILIAVYFLYIKTYYRFDYCVIHVSWISIDEVHRVEHDILTLSLTVLVWCSFAFVFPVFFCPYTSNFATVVLNYPLNNNGG